MGDLLEANVHPDQLDRLVRADSLNLQRHEKGRYRAKARFQNRKECVLMSGQCTATTKRGQRCKQRCTIPVDLCGRHLRERGLSIRRSELKPDGKQVTFQGLFACRRFTRREIVCSLVGGESTEDRVDQNGSVFGFTDLNDRTWDSMCVRGVGAFANHAPYDEGANLRFWTIRPRKGRVAWFPVLVAKRTIEPGEELLWDYGPDFWKGEDREVDTLGPTVTKGCCAPKDQACRARERKNDRPITNRPGRRIKPVLIHGKVNANPVFTNPQVKRSPPGLMRSDLETESESDESVAQEESESEDTGEIFDIQEIIDKYFERVSEKNYRKRGLELLKKKQLSLENLDNVMETLLGKKEFSLWEKDTMPFAEKMPDELHIPKEIRSQNRQKKLQTFWEHAKNMTTSKLISYINRTGYLLRADLHRLGPEKINKLKATLNRTKKGRSLLELLDPP